jgi:cell division septation protein DedD
MTHQRIIGITVLVCVFLLILPLLSSERPPKPLDDSMNQEITLPELPKNQTPVLEITMDDPAEPVTPAVLPSQPQRYAEPDPDKLAIPDLPKPRPTIRPASKPEVARKPTEVAAKPKPRPTPKPKPVEKPKPEAKPAPKPVPPSSSKGEGWAVQVASIAQSRANVVDTLQNALQSNGFKSYTEQAEVKGTTYIRIKTPAFTDKDSAIEAKEMINEKLQKHQVQAMIFYKK